MESASTSSPKPTLQQKYDGALQNEQLVIDTLSEIIKRTREKGKIDIALTELLEEKLRKVQPLPEHTFDLKNLLNGPEHENLSMRIAYFRLLILDQDTLYNCVSRTDFNGQEISDSILDSHIREALQTIYGDDISCLPLQKIIDDIKSKNIAHAGRRAREEEDASGHQQPPTKRQNTGQDMVASQRGATPPPTPQTPFYSTTSTASATYRTAGALTPSPHCMLLLPPPPVILVPSSLMKNDEAKTGEQELQPEKPLQIPNPKPPTPSPSGPKGTSANERSESNTKQ
jgi:hypothetical protein